MACLGFPSGGWAYQSSQRTQVSSKKLLQQAAANTTTQLQSLFTAGQPLNLTFAQATQSLLTSSGTTTTITSDIATMKADIKTVRDNQTTLGGTINNLSTAISGQISTTNQNVTTLEQSVAGAINNAALVKEWYDANQAAITKAVLDVPGAQSDLTKLMAAYSQVQQFVKEYKTVNDQDITDLKSAMAEEQKSTQTFTTWKPTIDTWKTDTTALLTTISTTNSTQTSDISTLQEKVWFKYTKLVLPDILDSTASYLAPLVLGTSMFGWITSCTNVGYNQTGSASLSRQWLITVPDPGFPIFPSFTMETKALGGSAESTYDTFQTGPPKVIAALPDKSYSIADQKASVASTSDWQSKFIISMVENAKVQVQVTLHIMWLKQQQ